MHIITLFRSSSVIAAVLALNSMYALSAPPQWYSQLYPSNTNSQISLTNASGGSVTAITNPTAASVKVNTSTNTQPPTVIVQATASLPIKVVGDACTATTSGTAPNESATEGTAILADRTSLLSCQSGAWAKSGGSTLVRDNVGNSSVFKNHIYCLVGSNKVVLRFDTGGTLDVSYHNSQHNTVMNFSPSTGNVVGSSGTLGTCGLYTSIQALTAAGYTFD